MLSYLQNESVGSISLLHQSVFTETAVRVPDTIQCGKMRVTKGVSCNYERNILAHMILAWNVFPELTINQ